MFDSVKLPRLLLFYNQECRVRFCWSYTFKDDNTRFHVVSMHVCTSTTGFLFISPTSHNSQKVTIDLVLQLLYEPDTNHELCSLNNKFLYCALPLLPFPHNVVYHFNACIIDLEYFFICCSFAPPLAFFRTLEHRHKLLGFFPRNRFGIANSILASFKNSPRCHTSYTHTHT